MNLYTVGGQTFAHECNYFSIASDPEAAKQKVLDQDPSLNIQWCHEETPESCRHMGDDYDALMHKAQDAPLMFDREVLS